MHASRIRTRPASPMLPLALALLALGASACKAPVAPEVREAMEDKGCDFVRKQAHPDPDALVCEWLQRDAAGEMMQASPWADGADLCPGHGPGPDVAWVVTAVDFHPLSRGKGRVEYEITRDVAGMLATTATGQRFEASPEQQRHKLVALQTPFGWRLKQPQALFIGAEVALRKRRLAAEHRAALGALPRLRKDPRCASR